jgi:hypothetical protein
VNLSGLPPAHEKKLFALSLFRRLLLRSVDRRTSGARSSGGSASRMAGGRCDRAGSGALKHVPSGGRWSPCRPCHGGGGSGAGGRGHVISAPGLSNALPALNFRFTRRCMRACRPASPWCGAVWVPAADPVRSPAWDATAHGGITDPARVRTADRVSLPGRSWPPLGLSAGSWRLLGRPYPEGCLLLPAVSELPDRTSLIRSPLRSFPASL